MEDMLSLSARDMRSLIASGHRHSLRPRAERLAALEDVLAGMAGFSRPIPDLDHIRRAPSATGTVPAVLDAHARRPAFSII